MSPLEGAIVQKVRVATRAIVVQARAPGRTFWIVVASLRDRGEVGVVGVRPLGGTALAALGAIPESEAARVRKLLEGARVVALGDEEIVLTRGDELVAVGARDR